MLRSKRRTAVVPKRNLLGKPVRGRMSLMETLRLTRDELLDRLDSGLLLPTIRGAAESNVNNSLVGAVYFPHAIVVSTDQTVLQGDLVWWDPINYTLKPLSLPSQVAVGATGGFCGAAAGTNVPGVYPTPPSGISENLPGVAVQRGGTVKVHGTTGDGTYFPFEPVTVGATQQTVTRGGQTAANRVGFVVVSVPVSARGTPGATPLPETVSGSTDVELWIESKFPDTVLL